MKVCDVVLNSVWYDPRVRKQINAYMSNSNIELSCVGLKCNRYDESKVKEIPCPTAVVFPDPKYAGKQKSIWKKIQRERSITLAIRDAIIAQKPDVIHANDLNALIPAYKASKKLKCPVIYDSHEIWVENFFLGKRRLYASYLKAKEKRLCKKIAKMVCVSHAAAEYFAKEYGIEKPMVITNCSLKSEQCYDAPKNEGFEILNHGQFYEGRGYDIMIESIPILRQHSEVKLALRGMGRLEESLKARAKEL